MYLLYIKMSAGYYQKKQKQRKTSKTSSWKVSRSSWERKNRKRQYVREQCRNLSEEEKNKNC